MPQPRWGGEEFRHTWEGLVPELDKLVLLYWLDLLTFEEIGKKTGHHWWHIKELFKAHNVPRMSLTERAKYKRQVLYPFFHRLVHEEQMSQRQIYKQYGYAPAMIRQSLQEGPDPMCTT